MVSRMEGVGCCSGEEEDKVMVMGLGALSGLYECK